MLDWLTWPADLLLRAGELVASCFVSEDQPSFVVIQMMTATLLLAAFVALLVYIQTPIEICRVAFPKRTSAFRSGDHPGNMLLAREPT